MKKLVTARDERDPYADETPTPFDTAMARVRKLEDELARVREVARAYIEGQKETARIHKKELEDERAICDAVVAERDTLREEVKSAREVIAATELAWGDMDPLLHSTTMLTIPLVRHLKQFGVHE